MPAEWTTWFQIGIMLLGLFYLLRALTRTPSRHAAYGIAALLGLYGLLKIAGLTILAGVLEQVFRVGVLVLIILFRDEARQMLGQVGKRARHVLQATTDQGSRTAARAVEEVAAAAERLAKTGYGGLIVIEMEDSLQEVAETGIRVDAALSAPLLETIFTSRSPLHDGAVIVRDLRVVAAGAVLPLFRGDLTELRRAGTRHRAALGLASSYDAAVIVVSEERGTIRVARAGTFIAVDPEHTRRELLSILTNEEDPIPDTGAGRATTMVARMAVGLMATYEAMLGWVRRGGHPEGPVERAAHKDPSM